jgi:copper chaperone
VSETRTYTVAGMTCEHCVASVREEVSEVAGVQGTEVALESGRLVVTGAGFTDDAIEAAVEEAGYALAP